MLRRGTLANAVVETVVAFVGDPIASRLVGSVNANELALRDPRFARNIVAGEPSSYEVEFAGYGGKLQEFRRLSNASNPATPAAGFNTALPGTSPPAGAYSTTQEALRSRQRMLGAMAR